MLTLFSVLMHTRYLEQDNLAQTILDCTRMERIASLTKSVKTSRSSLSPLHLLQSTSPSQLSSLSPLHLLQSTSPSQPSTMSQERPTPLNFATHMHCCLLVPLTMSVNESMKPFAECNNNLLLSLTMLRPCTGCACWACTLLTKMCSPCSHRMCLAASYCVVLHAI